MYWMAALAQLMPNVKNSIEKNKSFLPYRPQIQYEWGQALRCICHDHPCWWSGQEEKSISPRARTAYGTDARGGFWLCSPGFTCCIFSPGLPQQLCRQPGGTLGLSPLREPEIPPGAHGDSRVVPHSGTTDMKTEGEKNQKK